MECAKCNLKNNFIRIIFVLYLISVKRYLVKAKLSQKNYVDFLNSVNYHIKKDFRFKYSKMK